jgi:hypothetical protein
MIQDDDTEIAVIMRVLGSLIQRAGGEITVTQEDFDMLHGQCLAGDFSTEGQITFRLERGQQH